MHRISLLACLVACGETHMVARPLPELVANQRAEAASVHELLLVPNESMIWDVNAHGLTIGRAELVVGDREVHSRFGTGGLAKAFADVHYELTTVLDREAARPTAASETLTFNGKTEHIEAIFDGNGFTIEKTHRTGAIHTIHSALGWLRTWAKPHAQPTSIDILHSGERYRLEVGEPISEDLQGTAALRIDCHVHAGADSIAITIWLGDNDARLPIRIVATTGTLHLTAELIQTT